MGTDRNDIHATTRAACRQYQPRVIAFFHPDYTVGSGISPDLLTRMQRIRRSRARPRIGTIPPVGNHTLP